jgi:hypothetical protein
VYLTQAFNGTNNCLCRGTPLLQSLDRLPILRRDGRAYILPTNLETLIVYFSDEMLLSLDRLKQSFAHTKVAKPKLRAIAAIQYLERPELSDCEHNTDYVELGREAVIQFCVLR